MREIRTSGSTSGERKRTDAVWPKPPRLSSTLLQLNGKCRLRLDVNQGGAIPANLIFPSGKKTLLLCCGRTCRCEGGSFMNVGIPSRIGQSFVVAAALFVAAATVSSTVRATEDFGPVKPLKVDAKKAELGKRL